METITIPKAEYDALIATVAMLTAKMAELEARLNKNSKSSNKPPSSGGLRKGKVKNSCEKSGSQPGHEGTSKPLSPTPAKIVDLVPLRICSCGGEVTIANGSCITRQATDIEPIPFTSFFAVFAMILHYFIRFCNS